MKKTVLFDNLSVDVDFYKSFYKISGDEQTIRDHYATIGVSKHLIPNIECYTTILSIVLNFDLDVYVTNGSMNLGNTMICDNHGVAHTDKKMCHFMDHFYGNIMENAPTSNGQINLNVMRFLNSIDLMDYNNKWDLLINELMKYFNFDEDFYLFFYKDIVDSKNPFLDWLMDGIFKNRYPNMKSYNAKSNVIGELSSLLCQKNVDLNYIMKSYNDAIQSQKLLSDFALNLSEVELPLFVFFNTCRKKRLFWCENDRLKYVEIHSTKYSDTVKYLKDMNFYELSKLEKMMAANEKAHLDRIKKTSKRSSSNIVYDVEIIDTSLQLLTKIVNANYINTFKIINKLDLPAEDLLHKLLATLVNNIMDADKNINIMSFKSFVLSFFYNGMLSLKSTMSKEEYLTKVKTHAVKFLTNLFANNNISVNADVLLTDLECLIQNKKFIKLTRIATKLLTLVV